MKIGFSILLPISLFLCLNLAVVSTYGQERNSNRIRLALFADRGARPRQALCDALSSDSEISMDIVYGEDIRNGCLKNFDVLFVPGGSGKKESYSLGEDGRDAVCRFVQNGGIYLGVCAGCYLASSTRPQYLSLLPISTADKEHWQRGKATLTVEFTKLGMEIFGLKQTKADILYHNGPVFQKIGYQQRGILPLGYFDDEIVAENGSPELMIGAPAMVLGRYGNGLVLGISPHPEATPGLNKLEPSAIHWLYNHRTNIRQKDKISSATPASVKTTTLLRKQFAPDNALAEHIYDKAEEIFEHTTFSCYEHLHEGAQEQVQQIAGSYQITTDCSGFVSYVVRSVAPEHYAVLRVRTRSSYPHAKIFATFFRQLTKESSANGWLGINSLQDLQHGDLIAWAAPLNKQTGKHRNTGHVMIVVDPPQKIRTEIVRGSPVHFVDVYVIDSSSVEHFSPQVLPPLMHQQYRSGIGKGNIRLVIDQNSNVIGYWEGTFSHEKNRAILGPTYTDKIGFARLISLQHGL